MQFTSYLDVFGGTKLYDMHELEVDGARCAIRLTVSIIPLRNSPFYLS